MPTTQDALNARWSGRAAVDALDAQTAGEQPTESEAVIEAAAAAEPLAKVPAETDRE